MLDSRLIYLIGSFGDPGDRLGAAQKLAQLLGAENLILFSKDPILDVLLPVPGFPQTLPGGRAWRSLLEDCVKHRHGAAQLISPYSHQSETAVSFLAADGSVMVLLGGSPDFVQITEVAALVPLIVAALSKERIEFTAKGAIEAETIVAQQSKSLASALDASRRSLETALRKSTTILESITDAFFSLDRNWQFVEMNAAAEQLLEMKREQLLDRNIWEVFPESVGSVFQRRYQDALATQKASKFEEYFPSKKAWYEVRVYPSRDGVAIYFANIDSEKKMTEALRVSQEWFKTTLESIGDGVIAITKDRTISFLNPIAELLTGWTLNEALGKPMSEVFNIIHERTRKPAINPVDKVLKEGRVVGLANHTLLISRSGTEYPIEDSAAPIRSPQGDITGVVLVFRDVTETYAQKAKLQETHQKLQLERSRLEAILQQMPEGVIIAEPSGQMILRNAQMDKMLGDFIQCDSIEEYGKYRGFKQTGEPYLAYEWPLARSLTEAEKVIAEEVVLERVDGTRSVLSISSAPIYDVSGNIVAGVVIHHDITRLKETEAELRYQSYVTRTITDNAASCLFLMDKDGRPTFMNQAAMKVTGYHSLDEIKDQPLHYAVHWKKRDGSPYPMEDCPIDNAQAKLKNVQNQEEMFCKKDGTLFPVSYSVSPLEKEGRVIGSVLEFRDITDAKLTQEALIRSEKKLKAVLEHMPVGIGVVDSKGHLDYLNPHGVSIWGGKKDVDPNTYGEYQAWSMDTGKKLEANEWAIAQAVLEGKANSGQRLRIKTFDDKEKYILDAARPILGENGEIVGAVASAQDISFGVRIEQELEKQALALRDAIRSRDEFISICSHELKTPITSMKLQFQLTERLLNKGDNSVLVKERVERSVSTANRQLDRMTSLIEDMLDVSRIGAGKLQFNFEPLDIVALAYEVIDHFCDQFKLLNIPLGFTITGERISMIGDRYRLEQVVSNLLSNAINYGSGKPVHVSLRVEDSAVFLAVQDQGIGIAQENLERIFQRFERAISASNVSGLGLGLYITRQIVEAHRGKIWVESELGKGATFKVSLPLVSD